MKHSLLVKGMHCNSCKLLIQEALEDAGAKNVKIQLDEKKKEGKISLDSGMAKPQLIEVIEAQGEYRVQ